MAPLLNEWQRYVPPPGEIENIYGRVSEELARKFIHKRAKDLLEELYPGSTAGKGRLTKIDNPTVGDLWLRYDGPELGSIHMIFEVKYGHVVFSAAQKKRYGETVKALRDHTRVHVFRVWCRHGGRNFSKMNYCITEITQEVLHGTENTESVS